MFVAEYRDKLVDWNGDISIFEPMIPKIQKETDTTDFKIY
jgi:hypothetical protein